MFPQTATTKFKNDISNFKFSDEKSGELHTVQFGRYISMQYT